MEHRSDDLFILEFDHQVASYMLQSAKWSRFLAITWFVLCGLMVIGAIISVSDHGRISSDEGPALACFLAWVGVQLTGNIFRYKFARNAIRAVNDTDQEMLIASFGQLRTYNKYWGIVFIVGIALCLLAFAFGLLGAILGW